MIAAMAAIALVTGCSGGGKSTGTVLPVIIGTASPSASPSSSTSSASPIATSSATASTSPSSSPTSGASAKPTATATASTPTATPSASPTAAAPNPVATTANSCELLSQGSSSSFTCDNISDVQTGSSPVNDYVSQLNVENSTSTGAAPLYSANFYYETTPSGISVLGQIIASNTFVLTDTPNPLTAGDDISGFAFSQEQVSASESAPIQNAGESFTCSLFSGTTLIGTATANTTAQTSNGLTTTSSECEASYPAATPQENYVAYLSLNNGGIAPGTTYTWVISH
jgi:hypothetical protein